MELREVEVPKGSYAAGRRVRLPAGAEAPIRVYLNGVEQARGTDFELLGEELVFARPILKERVGAGRWIAMYLGLFGTYRANQTVDVEYRSAGRPQLASDLEVIAD